MDLALILAVALFGVFPALVLAACFWISRKPEGEAGPETWGALDVDSRYGKGRGQ